MADERSVCSVCGEVLDPERAAVLNGQYLHPDCLAEGLVNLLSTARSGGPAAYEIEFRPGVSAAEAYTQGLVTARLRFRSARRRGVPPK